MKFRVRTLSQLAFVSILALVISTSLTATPVRPAADKMTAEEVIAKHLESIGTAEARAKIKSHVIQGTAVGTYRLGGIGSSEGGSVMASQGTRNLVAIIYNNEKFPYEKLGFNGKDVSVAELRPRVHTQLGKFFMQYEMPLREGLLTGTLSAAWPLLDLSERGGKLKYAGTKKVNDRQAHVLEYQSKNNAGFKTILFFDAETFRHVRTEYEKRQIQQMPTGPSVTQQQGDAITKLTEDFSDFKPEGGLTLPHTYKLQLSIESLDRRILMDWIFTLTKFSFNNQLDDSQFDVRSSGNKT